MPPSTVRAKRPGPSAPAVTSAKATTGTPPQRKPPPPLPASNAAVLAALRTGDKKPLADPSQKQAQDKVGNGAVAAGLARGPGSDPKFAVLKTDVARKKRSVAGSHPPASAEATSAQDAALPPKDDEVAQGKTANAEKMNEAKPNDFDKDAFIRAVEKAIAEKAPKNLEQADEFAESGKPAEVKAEVAGKVGEGKADSAEQIAYTTAAPPDTSAAEAKKVTPMAPDRPPGTPDPAKATPDRLPKSTTDMSAGPAHVNQEMADAQVTEAQLKKSNEPSFNTALAEKKTAEQHAEATPDAQDINRCYVRGSAERAIELLTTLTPHRRLLLDRPELRHRHHLAPPTNNLDSRRRTPRNSRHTQTTSPPGPPSDPNPASTRH